MTITALPPTSTSPEPNDSESGDSNFSLSTPTPHPNDTVTEGQDQPTTNLTAQPNNWVSSASTSSDDHYLREAQHGLVVAGSNEDSEGDPGLDESHTSSAPLGELPLLHSPTLGLAAEIVDDLEKVRNANQNRLRQMTATGEDTGDEKKWEGRGWGMSESDPDVMRLAGLVNYLSVAYDDAVKNLEKTVKTHPLGKWVKKTPGIGEKQFGRLLAATGDPYWQYREDRPRTVSELWAYCGYHVLHAADQLQDGTQSGFVGGVAPKRKKGQKVNWSMTARMRMRLIAESCLKAKTSPYNKVYYDAREKYAESVHMVPCVQCGKKGTPAAVGTDLRPGHKHARALRIVSKTVLKDLWVESKRLHEEAQEEAIPGSETTACTPPPA